jgi:uncharacterized repeat protein (TIGR02543 family)
MCMKKKWNVIGIIIMVMMIGLLLAGCENPSSSGSKDDDDKDEVVMYTVTFDSNGGSSVSDKTVESGGTISLPAEPTKAGYDFRGWYSDNNTFATAFTSSTTVNSDITVYAKWIKVYEIGDTGPAGGLIFYKKEAVSDNWQYLEAAPASTEVSAAWGANGTEIGGTQQEIGTGKANTALIVTALDNLGETGKAAQICDELNVNGFDDWFLPSVGELALIRNNLYTAGLGGFDVNSRFSSTEDGASSAYVYLFDLNQSDSYSHKNPSTQCKVRAIRQF